jgi:hypothetical protein
LVGDNLDEGKVIYSDIFEEENLKMRGNLGILK